MSLGKRIRRPLPQCAHKRNEETEYRGPYNLFYCFTCIEEMLPERAMASDFVAALMQKYGWSSSTAYRMAGILLDQGKLTLTVWGKRYVIGVPQAQK